MGFPRFSPPTAWAALCGHFSLVDDTDPTHRFCYRTSAVGDLATYHDVVRGTQAGMPVLLRVCGEAGGKVTLVPNRRVKSLGDLLS